MNTYLHVLKNYAVFRGRASRKEYWVFYLYNITLIAIATLLDNIFGIALEDIGYGPICALYTLALLIPALAVTVRRLHDVGKSGWMILLVLIPLIGGIWLIVLLASKGNPEKNKFGEEPEEFLIDHPVADEIIFVYIIWVFFIDAFISFIPKMFPGFLDSANWVTIQIHLSIIYGIIPLSLALIVKNKSKRTLLLILGGLILLYRIYQIYQV